MPSFGFAQTSAAPADPVAKLRLSYSPEIVGDTLRIQGRIDSHIYDFLSLEAKNLERVRYIELNSLGGNAQWALEIARKLASLHKVTVLASGSYCASACVYLFAAGAEREADADTWLGVHGARLAGNYDSLFQGLCFIDLESGMVFEPRKKDCQSFLDHWFELSQKATLDAFAIMEATGVSSRLREDYMAMPDDPQWTEQLNVLRKPDWPITASEALKYNLVTKIRTPKP